MSEPLKASIVSGYFNPPHLGHIALMRAAKAMTGYLIVVVNNDVQQRTKKGTVITPQEQRLELVKEFRLVDEAYISRDDDASVTESLKAIRALHPDAELHFCNGGDRRDATLVPENEVRGCAEARITMHFGIGGTAKLDSSSRILEQLSWDDREETGN